MHSKVYNMVFGILAIG